VALLPPPPSPPQQRQKAECGEGEGSPDDPCVCEDTMKLARSLGCHLLIAARTPYNKMGVRYYRKRAVSNTYHEHNEDTD
jgi:hypothetical protein